MMGRNWRFGAAALALASWAVPVTPSVAEDAKPAEVKPVTIDDVKAIILGLGYDIPPNPYLEIKIPTSTATFYVGFTLSSDSKTINNYIILQVLPQDKLKNMPVCKMLYFNDTHSNFFSLNNKDADKRILLNSQLPAADLSPKAMRLAIDSIVADAVAADKIWDADQWTAAAFPTDCAPPD